MSSSWSVLAREQRSSGKQERYSLELERSPLRAASSESRARDRGG